MTNQQSIDCILNELKSAKKEHPTFPIDIVHQVGIMVEEAGEAIQAALNHYYHDSDLSKVEHELFQTGAMVLRCLENLQDCRDVKDASPFSTHKCAWIYTEVDRRYSVECNAHLYFYRSSAVDDGSYICPNCHREVEVIQTIL